MSYELDAAKRYHEHAEELRTIADHDRQENTRLILLRIARDYVVMASTLEKIEQTNRLVGKHQVST